MESHSHPRPSSGSLSPAVLRKEFASIRIVPWSASPSRTHVYVFNLNTVSGQRDKPQPGCIPGGRIVRSHRAFQAGSQFERILCQPHTRCSRTLVKRGHLVSEDIAAEWMGLYWPSCPLEDIDNAFMATERL
jgi:hypothetical protein